jgi:hypothetical protein
MALPGRSRWQSILALAVVIVGGAISPRAFAQNYRALQPPVAEAQARALTGRVATILRSTSNPGAEEIKVLDDFFMKNLFPSMTAYNPPEKLGELAELREQLFTRYINTAKSQGARDHLTSSALKAMGAIAVGNYHPSVRFNAALVVGQLDQTPGTPLPAAAENLVTLLEKDEINKVAVPTALKVAAIVGLQRRINGMEPAMAERAGKAATAIALRKELPDDASPQAYGWVRRNAAKLLTAQVAKGMTPDVHQTMLTLISDKSISLDDRCNIAQLLKPEMYQTADGVDFNAMAIALGDLAKQVLTLEAKEARKFEDEYLDSGVGFAPGGAGMPMGRGEMGMGMGMGGGFNMLPEDLGPTYEHRRMIDRLLAVAAGASAVAAGGPDETKARLTKLVDSLRGAALAAAEDKATLVDTAASVQRLSKDVNLLVANWAPAQAADDDAGADEFDEEAAAGDAEEAEADEADEDAADAEADAAPAEPAVGGAAAPSDAAG